MSHDKFSLKELRVLAQQKLGTLAAELKTRSELVAALDKWEARHSRPPPKSIRPLAAPLGGRVEPPPAAAAPIEAELPPEPVIWTGKGAPPKITIATAAPTSVPSAPRPPVRQDFFLEPGQVRPPLRYGDDRVLAFVRDPEGLYAAWDFSDLRFGNGGASGQVVDQAAVARGGFAVESPSGGAFVAGLPGGVPLKVEVRRGAAVLGESGWVVLPAQPEVKARVSVEVPFAAKLPAAGPTAAWTKGEEVAGGDSAATSRV